MTPEHWSSPPAFRSAPEWSTCTPDARTESRRRAGFRVRIRPAVPLACGGDGGGQGLLVKVGSNIINVNDAFADNTFHRYVIKLTFGTGATDTAEVFVDGVSTGPATNLANDITIDRAGFAAFRSEGTNPASGDTLVIATTFAEAAIPEPGSLALLGLGGLFVLGRRRI